MSGTGPRIVRLSYILHPSNKTCTFTATPEDYVIVARATIPALLHTCLEARDVALADYQQAFARRLLNPVYFDFEQDIIVGCPNTIVAFSVKDSELTDATLTGEEPIRRLMISEYPSGLFGRIFPTNRLNMLPFKALERIIIQQNTSSGQLLPLLVNRMSINWQRDFEDKPNYVCNFLHSEEMETKAMEMFSAPGKSRDFLSISRNITN